MKDEKTITKYLMVGITVLFLILMICMKPTPLMPTIDEVKIDYTALPELQGTSVPNRLEYHKEFLAESEKLK